MSSFSAYFVLLGRCCFDSCLRLKPATCASLKEAVSKADLSGSTTAVKGTHICPQCFGSSAFPARCICGRRPILDTAFDNLSGVHTLDMSGCDHSTIAYETFKNLRCKRTLNMSIAIRQPKAFENLRRIDLLNMSHCHQSALTD